MDIKQKLRLTDREKYGVRITINDTRAALEDGETCLVGKIFSPKQFGSVVVHNAMKHAWGLSGEEFQCRWLGINIFFFKFDEKFCLSRALKGGPWYLDDNILVLEPFYGDLSLSDYKFNKVKFWVHVIDPPMKCMTLACAERIGNSIGKLKEWAKGVGPIVWDRKMRIQVEVDILEPLMRGTYLKMEENRTIKWVQFQYEMLPSFCHWCGIIGHRMVDCDRKEEFAAGGGPPLYDESLKVVPENGTKSDTVGEEVSHVVGEGSKNLPDECKVKVMVSMNDKKTDMERTKSLFSNVYPPYGVSTRSRYGHRIF